MCMPFIGFTQDDCGDKPQYNGNKFGSYKISKEYKKYKKELKIWEECDELKNGDIVDEAYNYLDNNDLDLIEGIWTFMSQSGSLVSEVFIKKNGNYFDEIILKSFNRLYSGGKKGKLCCRVSDYASSGVYSFRPKSGLGGYTCVMKNNNLIECSSGYILVRNYPKEGEKRKSKNGKWAGNGSGIIISKSGHIITNHHVIDEADDIEVEFILDDEVQKFNAEIIQVDKTNDLAIIKIVDVNFDGIDSPPYNFKTRSSDVGTKVYAFGYPMALSIMGKEIKVTDGIISSKTGFDGNITTYQISAPIQGGNSGGPLFDDKGNLIGINSSGLKKNIADNVGYSIKTNYVLNLIDIIPKSIDLPSNRKLANLPLTEQIKEISKYVVLVKVK